MIANIYEYSIDSVIKGCHVHKTIWNLFVGEVSVCESKENKSHGI